MLDIFPSRTPWRIADQRYLSEHAFYRQLKSKQIELSGFTARLLLLTEAVIEDIFAEIPPEWNNGNKQKMMDHLGVMRDHAEEFAEEVRRFLV